MAQICVSSTGVSEENRGGGSGGVEEGMEAVHSGVIGDGVDGTATERRDVATAGDCGCDDDKEGSVAGNGGALKWWRRVQEWVL
uniref:DUF834 domain-containing protein n=1 Tax=Oryza nivara TaxID=4536 RepID=A0A0E0H9W5_ORYNI